MLQETDYIDQELEKIQYLYQTALPETPVELHLWWDEAKMTTPAVHNQDTVYSAEMLALSYIGGQRMGPAQSAQQPGKRVFLTVPSKRQLAEHSRVTLPWRARPWHFRLVHALSPRVAEQIKYLIEHRRWKRQNTDHKYSRLNYSRGVRELPSDTVDTGKDPAILIGLHWLDVGGAESLAVQNVQWALDAGLRVFVLVGQVGAERLAGKIPDDPRVTLLRTDRYLPRELISAFVANLIANENIILTHNHHCVPLYDALPTIKMRHPHVVNLDSTHIVEYADGGYPRISGVWSNYLDHHHVISTELVGFYREQFRIHGRKVVVGRLLDDAQRGDPVAPIRVTAGQKTCRVAFVGRMVHQKRPTIVVEIIKRLLKWGRKNGVQFTFDMVGEGPYREAVERLLRRYGMQEAVQLHPAGTDVPALLADSEVLLLPSSNEGLALVCYEAIEAGCVPISSDVGAQKEICPKETLVPWGPEGAIRQSVACVARLLTDPGFGPQVEAAQRAKLEALRAEPSAREVITKIYREVLDARAESDAATAPVISAVGAE